MGISFHVVTKVHFVIQYWYFVQNRIKSFIQVNITVVIPRCRPMHTERDIQLVLAQLTFAFNIFVFVSLLTSGANETLRFHQELVVPVPLCTDQGECHACYSKTWTKVRYTWSYFDCSPNPYLHFFHELKNVFMCGVHASLRSKTSINQTEWVKFNLRCISIRKSWGMSCLLKLVAPVLVSD